MTTDKPQAEELERPDDSDSAMTGTELKKIFRTAIVIARVKELINDHPALLHSLEAWIEDKERTDVE